MNQKIAIKHFFDMLKPGGILIIDHRNYDYILTHGKSPNKNIYYNSSIYKVISRTVYEDNKAKQKPKFFFGRVAPSWKLSKQVNLPPLGS